MFRGSVKSTDFPLHSPVYPSLSLPCVNVCHHISTGLYFCNTDWTKPSTLQSVLPYPEGRWKPGSSKESNKRYGSWLGLVILRATVFHIRYGQKQVCRTPGKISSFDYYVFLLYVAEQTPVLLHSAHVSLGSRILRNDFSITEHNTTILYDFFYVPLFGRDAVNPYSNAIRCKVPCETRVTKWAVNWNVRMKVVYLPTDAQ